MNRTIYYNAQIITMEDDKPYAQALLIEDETIKKVGGNQEILSLQNEGTLLVDLNQKVMLPGFIDAHSHISSMIFHQLMTDIGPSQCKTIEELVEVLRRTYQEEKPQDGEWLIGWGYDNTIFEEERHPTKYELNKVSTSVPIIILHTSGQCAVCNSPALKEFGYAGESFKVPSGGFVERLKKDTTGLIKGNALYHNDVIPFPPVEKIIQAFQKASYKYVSHGITTVQDAKTGTLDYILLKNLANLKVFNIDIISYVTKDTLKKMLEDYIRPFQPYQNHYRVGGYKIKIDGAPHLKTSWISEPYYIVPQEMAENYRGFPLMTEDETLKACKLCLENNCQINAHCSGDAACDQFLNAYSEALKKIEPKFPLRPVITHAQTVREDQLDKMKELGVIPTFFLDQIYYSGDDYYESVFGAKRAKSISPLKSAMERGLIFTLHQNAPAILPNMLFSVHNAVNRITKNGRILGEEQTIPVIEALKAITIFAAYQIFEEERKGSIRPGKLADLVILDKNPLQVEKDKLKDIEVLDTIKEGKAVFHKPQL